MIGLLLLTTVWQFAEIVELPPANQPMPFREWITNPRHQPWHYQQYIVPEIPFRVHYHPEFELTLTRNACGLRYVSGEMARFDGPDLVLVAPNEPHSWQSARNTDGSSQQLQIVFFNAGWLQTLAEQGLPELRQICGWLARVRHGLCFSPAAIAAALPLFARLHEARGLERVNLLFTLFAALQRDEGAQPLGDPLARQVPDARIELALAHLQGHYRHKVTLAEVAAAARCSEATLKRLLAEKLGQSVTGILNQLRVTHACNLLIGSKQSLDSIAADSGFPSPSNFYRLFARQTGQTPADYRRSRRV